MNEIDHAIRIETPHTDEYDVAIGTGLQGSNGGSANPVEVKVRRVAGELQAECQTKLDPVSKASFEGIAKREVRKRFVMAFLDSLPAADKPLKYESQGVVESKVKEWLERTGHEVSYVNISQLTVDAIKMSNANK